jgi:hypothetical protein
VNRLLAGGFALIVLAEALVLVVPQRDRALAGAGLLAAVVLVVVRWQIVRGPGRRVLAPGDGPAQGLHRWLGRTRTLIERSESSRADWDRHLRPMLARQFELATGQRKSKNANAFDATGRMLFGDELWPWVDPDNVSRSGHDGPGPGRAVLDEILRRLERV